MNTAEHEAVHCAAAIWQRRPVELVEVYPGHHLPGDTAGFCLCPVVQKIDPSQVVIAISARMADPKSDWPLPYERAREERLEGLGRVLGILDLSGAEYERLVSATRRMLDNPDFQRLRDAIARALARVPRLDGQAVSELAAAVGIPVPEEGVTHAA